MVHMRSLVPVAIVCLLASAVQAGEHDAARLLAGVKEIAAPGSPGPLCVFGKRAYPLVLGRAGKGVFEPVAAAAEFGKGRVVAFGHDGFVTPGAARQADTSKLLENAIVWVAHRDTPRQTAPLRVGVYHARGLVAYLRGLDIPTEPLRGAGWLTRLRECNVLVCNVHALRDADIPAVRRFIRAGGGVVAGGLGWGWLQLNPGKTLDQHPGNRLLAPAGIVWADGTLARTGQTGFLVTLPVSPACQASQALAILESAARHEKIKRDKKEIAQAVWTATRAYRVLPADDTLLRPRFRKLARRYRGHVVPTHEKPIRMGRPLARLLLTMELDEVMHAPPAKVRPHPAARIFPGAVPEGAKRVTRVVDVDSTVPGWHSTGLYAPPGALIVATIPRTATQMNLRLRIGAHRDKLWHKNVWRRCPEITRTFAMGKPVTRAANAFGGLIYVVVPRGCSPAVVRVEIRNAVEAPLFVLGRTDLDEWRSTIRKRPAPWAELASDKIILTVPSERVRTLDDPTPLMKVWDRVADAEAELACRPKKRLRPERYVADEQISAGYMHAGYPIMTHLDAAAWMVDADHILHKGAWGLFHELGHNHQSADWTFAGTGEVTVNLFTLYVFEKVCGKYETSRPALFGKKREETIRKYLAGGAKFSEWKSKPFLALLMYMQLKEGFGWDAYKKVFAEYRDLPKSARPKSDAEKRDQWMVRFSRAVGRNLGPFFETWGIPTSAKARASIADLPPWMPEGFPPQ